FTTNQNANTDRALAIQRGVFDSTIEDMVFTGSTLPAVLAQHVDLLRVDRNRVAMRNVRSQWPAIFASGNEIHIDRNFVRILTTAVATEWLPATVVDDLTNADTVSTQAVLTSAASNTTLNSASTANTTAATTAEADVTRTFVAESGLNLISVNV